MVGWWWWWFECVAMLQLLKVNPSHASDRRVERGEGEFLEHSVVFNLAIFFETLVLLL